MAERFGGKFSPGDAPKPAGAPDAPVLTSGPQGPRRTRSESRLSIFYFAPVIILINAFRGDAAQMLYGFAAFGTLILAAWLTQSGTAAQAAFDARRVARKPAIPRKLFATALTFIGLTLGGLMSQPSILLPIGFGIAGAILHFLAFGPDPLRNKGMEGVDDFQSQRVATAVDEGEAYLAATRDEAARTAYGALLDDLETNFASRTQALLDNERTDLTVEIEVLRERLALEH